MATDAIERTVAGTMTIDGQLVGTGEGSIVDEYADQDMEESVAKTINVVLSVDGSDVGGGTIPYLDYISYDGGGERTETGQGTVNVDGTDVGIVEWSIPDKYGAVVQGPQPPPAETQPVGGATGEGGLGRALLILIALVLLYWLVKRYWR